MGGSGSPAINPGGGDGPGWKAVCAFLGSVDAVWILWRVLILPVFIGNPKYLEVLLKCLLKALVCFWPAGCHARLWNVLGDWGAAVWRGAAVWSGGCSLVPGARAARVTRLNGGGRETSSLGHIRPIGLMFDIPVLLWPVNLWFEGGKPAILQGSTALWKTWFGNYTD